MSLVGRLKPSPGVYTGAITVLGVALAALAWKSGANPSGVALLVVSAAFAVGELAVVHLRLGGSTFSLTFHEAVLVLALAYAQPSELTLGVILGSLPVLVAQRLPLLKIVFNLGQYLIWTGGASLVVRPHLGAHSSSNAWPLVGLTVMLMSGCTLIFVSTAIHLSDRTSIVAVLRRSALGSVSTSALSTSLGLIALPVTIADRGRLALVIPIAAAAYFGNRAVHQARRQVTQLQLLQRVVEQVSQHGDPITGLESFTRECVSAFGALRAIVVIDRPDGTPAMLMNNAGQCAGWSDSDPDLHVAMRSIAAAGGRNGVVLRRDGGLLTPIFEQPGTEVVLVAQVGCDGAVIALTQGQTPQPFSRSDADLLGALCSHVAVVLDGRRLRDEHEGMRRAHGELRRRAERDPATGALSRFGVEQLLDAQLEASTERMWGAVRVHLHGLDEVADLYGTEAVEEVVQAMYRRICSLMRPGDDVARTEPGSFVVVATGVNDASDLRALSKRLESQLAAPYGLANGGGTVRISAETSDLLRESDDTSGSGMLSRLDDELHRRRLVRRFRSA